MIGQVISIAGRKPPPTMLKTNRQRRTEFSMRTALRSLFRRDEPTRQRRCPKPGVRRFARSDRNAWSAQRVATSGFALYSVLFLRYILATALARPAAARFWRPQKGECPAFSSCDLPTLLGFPHGSRNHEEAEAQPPARSLCEAGTAPPHQPRFLPSQTHPDAVCPLCGGPGRATGVDLPAQVLCLVSPAGTVAAASLGLRGTAQRDLPLRRMPRGRRCDGGPCSECLILRRAC